MRSLAEASHPYGNRSLPVEQSYRKPYGVDGLYKKVHTQTFTGEFDHGADSIVDLHLNNIAIDQVRLQTLFNIYAGDAGNAEAVSPYPFLWSRIELLHNGELINFLEEQQLDLIARQSSLDEQVSAGYDTTEANLITDTNQRLMDISLDALFAPLKGLSTSAIKTAVGENIQLRMIVKTIPNFVRAANNTVTQATANVTSLITYGVELDPQVSKGLVSAMRSEQGLQRYFLRSVKVFNAALPVTANQTAQLTAGRGYYSHVDCFLRQNSLQNSNDSSTLQHQTYEAFDANDRISFGDNTSPTKWCNNTNLSLLQKLSGHKIRVRSDGAGAVITPTCWTFSASETPYQEMTNHSGEGYFYFQGSNTEEVTFDMNAVFANAPQFQAYAYLSSALSIRNGVMTSNKVGSK